MEQSDWCKIHILRQGSDWCEQHATLHTINIDFQKSESLLIYLFQKEQNALIMNMYFHVGYLSKSGVKFRF